MFSQYFTSDSTIFKNPCGRSSVIPFDELQFPLKDNAFHDEIQRSDLKRKSQVKKNDDLLVQIPQKQPKSNLLLGVVKQQLSNPKTW